MSLKSLLKRFGLAMGMLEIAPRSPRDINDLIVVPTTDTFEGVIDTTHDVLVNGTVRGTIMSPAKTVEIAKGGRVVGPVIHADTFVWRGELGGVKVICRTLIIEPGATNTPGLQSPGISYERLHINDCTNTSVRLSFAPYQESVLLAPSLEPKGAATPESSGTVVALELASKARHNGASFASHQAP